MRHYVKKYWSFVLFQDERPILYYPYKFFTKARCKQTALIMSDIMYCNRICIYDNRHYPDLFKDLPDVPNTGKFVSIDDSEKCTFNHPQK